MIPNPSTLTTEWLTDALRRENVIGDKTSVSSFSLTPLSDAQGITAQQAILELTYSPPESQAPASLFAKFSTTDPELLEGMHSYDVYRREVDFYQRYANPTPLRTPNCYYSDIDPETSACILLLEDLRSWQGGSWLAGCGVAEAELVVRELAKLHAAWWEHPQLASMNYKPDRASFQRFGRIREELMQPYLESTTIDVAPDLIAAFERVSTNIVWVLEQLFLEAPRTLIHYDVHLDNLMFERTEANELRVTIIDWQLFHPGKAAYDLAYFLVGNLPPELRRDHDVSLLQKYHDQLGDLKVKGYSFESLVKDYQLLMLEGFFRMVHIPMLFDLSPEQESAHLEVYAMRFLSAMQDHKALDRLPC